MKTAESRPLKGMLTDERRTVTQLLERAAASDSSAAVELLPIVYDELHALASAWFRDQPHDHTLQPTALVHEAYAKLVAPPLDGRIRTWSGRGHFFAVAAAAMRSILVDHARRRSRRKRGGNADGAARRVALHEIGAAPAGLDDATLLAIDDAMTRLGALDERKAKLVELRFFAGLNADEAADALGIARSTAAEEWRMARAWLHLELKDRG